MSGAGKGASRVTDKLCIHSGGLSGHRCETEGISGGLPAVESVSFKSLNELGFRMSGEGAGEGCKEECEGIFHEGKRGLG